MSPPPSDDQRATTRRGRYSANWAAIETSSRSCGTRIGPGFAGTSIRLALPPAVADAIARQRDSVTGRVRVKIGKASAEARKLRGEEPG